MNERLLIPAAVVLTMLASSGCGTVNSGDLVDFPGTTRQQLVVERANPAVLLLVIEYKATISVPSIGLNNTALAALVAQIVQKADTGQISNDLKTKVDAFVQGIASDPDAYLTASGTAQQVPATAAFQCTGSIVTPDGYIVTAAHCTRPAADELTKAYVQSGLAPVLDADVKQLEADLASQGFDADQTKLLANAAATFAANHSTFTDETRTISAALFSTSSTGQRQALFVDGFPAAAENGNINNAATPTVTDGSVASKKVSDQGVPLLETSATVSGGNSGGPGLDDAGNMVGVVSYGTTSGGSYNYLIGASVVQQFLREKNVQPRESLTTRTYNLALNDFHLRYYKRALPEFQQVKALYPGHKYVDTFIQQAQVALQEGRDQTPLIDGTALEVAVAGAVTLLLVLVTLAVVIGVLWTRRAGRVPAPPAGPASGWPSSPAPPDPRVQDLGWRWDGQQWVRWDGQRWVPFTGDPPGPDYTAPPGR